jgi:hypothetical protein
MPHARASLPQLCAIVAWFALCELLIWPSADVPLIDDWTYAWSVQHLLQTGELQILPISAVYPATQIIWGALFSTFQGFSFTALRLSTIVLACIGAIALYLTLLELGVGRARALLGTACVACNPVSVVLTNSFMTDVPLVSVSNCAMYAYVRGFARRTPRWLWIAAAASVAAVLVRQVALVVPFAAAGACLFTRDAALRRVAVVPTVVGCAAAVTAWQVAGLVLGPSNIQGERLDQIRYVLDVGLRGYALLNAELALTLALMLLPLTLALRHRLGWLFGVATAALGSYAFASFDPFDPDRVTLSLFELGATRNLIAGAFERPSYARELVQVGRVIAFIAVGASLAAVLTASRRRFQLLLARPQNRLFVFSIALHGGLITVLWLYSDRYYLALIPSIVACVLVLVPTSRAGTFAACTALVVQTVIGVVGTRDALRYNEACASSYAALLRAGVRPYDIDAGWSWNGWMLYAQPHHLPRELDRDSDTPAVTAKRAAPYLIAKSRVPGYQVIRHVRWKGRAWPAPNELFVLKRAG